ncbi:MAG: HesA/MoeB/ThiF family protein [Methanomicrobiales archaeon]|nr:HesA/MoeB/ThiF family protein [Methanomicrobiales archaeon]
MLSRQEKERYRRQILIFGEEGQERLKKARILIAGVGGLGSPVATYLAAAGVGHLLLVDHDCVERSNLNRQILHWEADIGKAKTQSAGEKLCQMNETIEIETEQVTLTESTIGAYARRVDGIVDALDNFGTRYLLNRAALAHRIPLFHGAIWGNDGQVTTIIPGKTVCLRCVFPHPPPGGEFPVIGTAPGVIGLIQANEVIKYLTGRGSLLENRLLLWNGACSVLEEVAVSSSPHCIDCGKSRVNPVEKGST